jgi:hypothetical protein
MIKSTLYQVVRSFSVVEKREVRKFLTSPFFNQRQDLNDLFDVLSNSTRELDKESAWKALYGELPYDDQKWRLLMSYLHKLLEQYILIHDLMTDERAAQIQLAKAYRKRGMTAPFERVSKRMQSNLEEQPLRDVYFYQNQFDLQWESFQLSYVQNPTEATQLNELSKSSDVVYLTIKLRIICMRTAHQLVYPAADYDQTWTEAVIEMAGKLESEDYPAIRVYLQCYRLLRYPEAEEHFMRFKKILFEESSRFTKDEMHGLFIWAINHCVRQINAGESRYFNEVLDLYKEGLVKEYLFENDVLSRFTYHNIVAAGLNTGDLDWVRYFIHEYKNRLEKEYRESSYSFNQARLEYASLRYDLVLDLLQKANYRDPLLNLAAKTLLLKTYYDMGELDSLQSHLDAMRNYIHRKRVIGYHKTNYLNIIRYTEKMLRINMNDKQATLELWTAIEAEKVLTEKPYFQKMLRISVIS